MPPRHNNQRRLTNENLKALREDVLENYMEAEELIQKAHSIQVSRNFIGDIELWDFVQKELVIHYGQLTDDS